MKKFSGRGAARLLSVGVGSLYCAACSLLPAPWQPPLIHVPEFFPQSPDAGPQATAPPVLAVPPGHYLVLVLAGSGYQDYECKLQDGGPAWVFNGPQATLYSSDTKKVGTHGAGPTWTYVDGSVVHGQVMAEAPSKVPASIPQLLMRAQSDDQAGMFHGVSYVQRLRTVGGLPPDYGCDAAHVGAKLGRQYSAFYLFYKPNGVQ